jgi:hypothetical protein
MSSDQVGEMLDELRQMRQLLELMAEPAIAQRDAKRRTALMGIVGSSPKKQQSVFLMDGTRTQAEIVAKTAVSSGALSEMVTELHGNGLLTGEKKKPKLAISIPVNFFDVNTESKRR